MKVSEARELLANPVFGSDLHIQARDVMILAEELKQARDDFEPMDGVDIWSVAPRLEDMEEDELREEIDGIQYIAGGI